MRPLCKHMPRGSAQAWLFVKGGTAVTEYFDAVVSGAGPAGSVAARIIAQAGFKVLLAEKRQEVGTPVRCAEGVSAKWLHRHTGVKKEWVCAEVRGAVLSGPGGGSACMEYGETGYILDRHLFDRDLAFAAAAEGAILRTKCPVTGVEAEENGFFVRLGGGWKDVRVKMIIAADGIESVTASMLGVDTSLKPSDIESCMQYTLGGVETNRDHIELIGGNNIAPGGYAWIFPKGDKQANVGLGLLGARSSYSYNAKFYLDNFVATRFPGASVLRTSAGAVSASKPLEKMFGKGFLIAGDAAHLANPLTGAGIGNALESGAAAGKTAAECLKNEDVSEEALSAYQDAVMKSIGNTTRKFYRIKEHFVEFSDRDIDNMIRLASQIDPANITVGKILELAFKENKAVLSLIRKAF